MNNSHAPSNSDENMALVKQEDKGIDEYHSIYTKLKKLHDIAKTNEISESDEGSQNDDNKLAPKRKPDLYLDGLSDDSTLNSSVNKTKRRRFSDSQDYSPSNFHVENNRPSHRYKSKYSLTVSNLPGEWTYDQIKHYVSDECGVNVLRTIDSRSEKSDYQLRLQFTNQEQYESVLNKIQKKENEGKLKITSGDKSDDDSEDSEATVFIGKDNVKSEPTTFTPENDQEKDLFGLNSAFLKSLNIEPPLVKWINVSNFRCDKWELRDIFEMAGRVVTCVVINTSHKYAKIMYSHPLEAVQAVSLLNGQIYYGQTLKVSLDPNAELGILLPKGLQNFGVGLGQMGKPLRDVVSEYERFVNGKPSSLNPSIFSAAGPDSNDFERYSPSKPTMSGQYGATGQRNVAICEQDNPQEPVSPRPAQSFTPTQPSVSSLNIKQERSPTIVPNPLANASVVCPMQTKGSISADQKPAVLNSQMEQYRTSSPITHLTPKCGQFGFQGPYPLGPNLQGRPGPNFQGPLGPTLQAPPGANFQGPPGANFHALPGPNFQGPPGQMPGPAQFNTRNPQMPSNFRPNGPFMQNGPSYMNGPGPSMVPPVQNMGPNASFSPTRNVMVLKGKDAITLQITNLSPRATFASLCGKLSQVGQVMSLEFTSPGCALVKFSNPSEAERCFQYFSPSRFGYELGVL